MTDQVLLSRVIAAYESRFQQAREAWDEIAVEVAGFAEARANGKMVEALSGCKFVAPDAADMQWATAVAKDMIENQN